MTTGASGFDPVVCVSRPAFEVLGITADIGTVLGVDARLWPQGANAAAAVRWLNAHRDTGDMMMVIAAGVFVHGTVSESPVEIVDVEIEVGVLEARPVGV